MRIAYREGFRVGIRGGVASPLQLAPQERAQALGVSIADVRAAYEFGGALKNVSVFIQGHNITNEPFQEYTNNPDIITNKVLYGRTYSAGLNVKF